MGDCIEESLIETSQGRLYLKKNLEGKGVPIVLLHGFSFTSDVWSNIGLYGELCRRKISFVAPDMPYGVKVKRSFRARNIERNIEALREALGELDVTQAYLVGASLGGYAALRYTVTYDRVVGMTLIAPVNSLEDDIIDYMRETGIHVLVVYGSRDDIVDIEEMRKFVEEVGNAELKIYENAPHPAYLAYPERFREDLIRHYAESIQGGV